MSVVDYSNKRIFPVAGKTPKIQKWQETKVGDLSVSYTGNFGWALDSEDLIIDIDPRNGGDKAFIDLCRDAGCRLDELATVKVETGGGGLHLYFKKPDGFKIRKTLKGIYDGIDFLSKGAYILGAGSIHKDTGKAYEFTIDSLRIDEAVDAPESLLKLIKNNKAERQQETGTGEYTNHPADLESYRKHVVAHPDVYEGDRDNRTFLLACAAKDYGIDADHAIEILCEHWADKCHPPVDEELITDKVYASGNYGTRPIGVSSTPKILADMGFSEDVEPEKAAEELKAKLSDEDQVKESDFFDGYDNNEPANAKKVLHRLFPDRTIKRNEFGIRKFNGKYYEEWADDRLKQIIQREMSDFGVRHSIISNTTACVRNEIYEESFTEDPIAVCFNNCVARFKNKEIEVLPHSKDLYCFSIKNMDFDKDADDPVEWLKFLNSSLENDQERIKLLQEWMGYSLVEGNHYQKILILVGKSRCGKGTIGRIMSELCGSVGTSLEGLCGDFGLSTVAKARSAVIGDAHRVRKHNYERAKEVLLTISGRDQMDINTKYKAIESVRLETKLTLMCNQMPAFSDGADALTNRYLVIPFNKSFAGKEDIYLDDRLNKELGQIMAWAVRGLYRLIEQNGFTYGEESKKTLEALKKRYNQVGAFVEEYCELVPENVELASTVYDAYVRFCNEEDRTPVTRMVFTERLQMALEDFEVVKQGRALAFKGLALKDLAMMELEGFIN